MAKRTSIRKADLLEWARGFSLLSDPTRLGILAQLAKGQKNVTALCKALGLKPPTVSYHLGLLRARLRLTLRSTRRRWQLDSHSGWHKNRGQVN